MSVLSQRPEISLDHIVAGTDFSATSQVACAYAAAMARHFGAELDLVNIIDLSIATMSSEGPTQCLLDAMRQSSEDGLREAVEGIPGVRVQTKVQVGFSPPDDLLLVAREFNADVIVLGTAAKHGMEKLILGSTAEQVIREAACPVLTVGPRVPPPAQGVLTFQRIVCADDFSKESSKALSYALSFAEDSAAHLYVCHVADDPTCEPIPPGQEYLQRRMRELIPAESTEWCTTECVVAYGKAPAEIVGFARRVGADLIVLGSRHGSFWLNYVHPGTTPAVLAEAECPLLTVC